MCLGKVEWTHNILLLLPHTQQLMFTVIDLDTYDIIIHYATVCMTLMDSSKPTDTFLYYTSSKVCVYTVYVKQGCTYM